MLLTLIQSFARFFASEIRKVASQMHEEYQNDIMGKVAITIYRHHKGLSNYLQVMSGSSRVLRWDTR